MPTYYKAVKKTFDGRFTSSHVDGAALTTYEVGKLSRPPEWLEREGYGLTVFDTKENAMTYARGMGASQRVFRVAVLGPVREPRDFMGTLYLSNGILKANPYCANRWPTGTMMVDGVILMEEV